MSKKAKLLWVDLEMTGLDPEKDRILEVAAVATGMDLEPIANFRAVVKVDEDLMRERMVGEFWQKNRKAYDGLMAQNADGEPVAVVEQKLLKFLDEHFGNQIYLAGNSIHQDRRFIIREMPNLDQRLHYRMLDVTSWKIYFENALGKRFTKPENHRAEDDIAGSIEELKWYLTFLKKDKE